MRKNTFYSVLRLHTFYSVLGLHTFNTEDTLPIDGPYITTHRILMFGAIGHITK